MVVCYTSFSKHHIWMPALFHRGEMAISKLPGNTVFTEGLLHFHFHLHMCVFPCLMTLHGCIKLLVTLGRFPPPGATLCQLAIWMAQA